VTESPSVAMYESLARFQWWRRKLGRAAVGEALEIRKRLLPPTKRGPANGAAGLDSWLMGLAKGRARERMLDLGCGFGASMFRWVDDGVSQVVGVTPSAYQVKRGREVAARKQVSDQCHFLQQSLEMPFPGEFDLALAIEALGHSQDLDKVLGHVRASMHGKGSLLWVEDLLQDPADADEDVLALSQAWSSPPLRAVGQIRSSLQSAGFRIVNEVDLTPQVPRRDAVVIARSLRSARRWQSLLPISFARGICQAFMGGFLLERLYARGMACYRVVLAEPAQE
jgi:SAM-dependent methyltransferase